MMKFKLLDMFVDLFQRLSNSRRQQFVVGLGVKVRRVLFNHIEGTGDKIAQTIG